MKSEKGQKASKHRKKGPKEKKKSNKKKHRRSQDERKSSEERSFSALLSSGILHFPSLFEDFPAMISTIDSGQAVNIYKISDKKKAFILNKLFSCLPLINDSNYGWHSNSKTGEKISSIILKKLLEEKVIKQPKELNQSELLASQKAPSTLLVLVSNFPELLNEIPTLLSSLLDGKAIDVEDIENEDVRDGLESLFKSLDLAFDSGYVLPSDSRRTVTFGALESLKDLIVSHQQFSSDMELGDDPGDVSGSDNSSDDEGEDNGSIDRHSRGRRNDEEKSVGQGDIAPRDRDDATVVEPIVRKGPAMPTREQLALAQSHLLRNPQPSIEDEEDDNEEEDGVGPRMYDPAKDASLLLRQSLQKVLPLGFTGVELESAIETITSAAMQSTSSSTGHPAESNEEPKEINEREEWILTPGNSKLISELDSSVNKNRKFQTGKHAKQQVAELNRRQQNLPPSVATGEADSIMAEYREKRGPSLMDAHADKKAKGPSGREKGRKAFDRDMEFLSHRSMDSMQVQQLVEKAKDMDSRFDRGSVQKSFL